MKPWRRKPELVVEDISRPPTYRACTCCIQGRPLGHVCAECEQFHLLLAQVEKAHRDFHAAGAEIRDIYYRAEQAVRASLTPPD